MRDLWFPAEELYTGEQNRRLMLGVRAWRALRGSDELDLRIVSARYGLVKGDDVLAPYEVTFGTMGSAARRVRGRRLELPQRLEEVLREPYDLAVMLLGA